ncbi:MAG: type VI secretion system contractile sheath small subunit [Chelatococcus sp.]|uniref:type VI secretion system contractile sheath small subunit n=1 Tax=Chelatococcus sp. TaxID=1953771 RepID=UPI0025BB692E|nr:type VI secretion system contractile sheath small subunit [Chelatococcus sp.]MBX3538645.1 type VI secretion system contractile sheath small subunit [Chelatococcus sp.]
MADGIHQKLARVRKPRVHITYDVEVEGAVVQKELPFVVGVMGDYSGDAAASLPPLRERKFVQIDRDNFNDVMGRVAPALSLRVDNTLTQDGDSFSVNLAFRTMDDFEPANVVAQIEPLRRLLEARNHLRDLMGKIDRSENLELLLEDVLKSEQKILALSSELGIDKPDSAKE